MAPAEALKAPNAPEMSSPPLMAMQQRNANSCTVHLNPTRRTRTSSRHTLPDRGDQLSENTPLSRIQFVRWDGVAKQPSAHIDCVVPRDSAAVAAVKAHFLAGDGAAIGQRVRSVLTPVPAAMSTTFYPGMTCWYYHDDNRFECMGVTCIAGGDAIRVDNGTDVAPAKSSEFDGHTQSIEGTPQSVFYMCDNGCSLHLLLDGNVGYYCDEEEDGDGDGPGDSPGDGPGGGGPNPDLLSTFPLENGTCLGLLCAPSLDDVADYCESESPEPEFCEGVPADPFAAAAFNGRSVALVGCLYAQQIVTGPGTHLGLPAEHSFGFVRRLVIPSWSGPYSTGTYSMSVRVSTGGQILRYRGAAQVDCEDGTFIGVGVRRNWLD